MTSLSSLTPSGVVLIAGVAVRVVAALVLIAGPWTNEPAELEGWDVARFQEIADAPGRPWVDHDVEYPPGSVVAIEAIAQDGVVESHRILAAIALAVDLGVALLLALAAGRRAAAAYLLLGLPLLPAGLVRFDLLAVALAVVAEIAVVGVPGGRRRDDGAAPHDGPSASDDPAAHDGAAAHDDRAPEAARYHPRNGSFAAIVTAAALVKVWPALLVAGAVALGRRTAAVMAVVTMAVAGAGWLIYGGVSLDPIDQVLSLRGATGWHVESLGGTITALTSDAEPERQLDAFRIGELDRTMVTAGRVVAVAVAVALAWLVHRRRIADERSSPPADAAARFGRELELLSLFMLGSTAALLVTAPLLSPQFLLWLTPWAATLAGGPRSTRSTRPTGPLALTGAITLITGGVLTVYGPPNVAQTVPAALLLVRNVLLIALVAAVARQLADRGDRACADTGNHEAAPATAR